MTGFIEKLPPILQKAIPESPNWPEVFGNRNPTELEIGIGRPHFIFERANHVSEHNLVGIEWKQQWIEQANKKIAREKIPNVATYHGNAWLLVPTWFENGSLSNIIINFPDPWWKKRHQKRRILNDEFTDILVEKLKAGGTIFVQSDVSLLMEEYVGILLKHKQLQSLGSENGLYENNPMSARSHREKKCEEMGVPIYRAFFKKV